MNKCEFSEFMKEINIAYGDKKFPLSKETMDVWFKYLKSCNYSIILNVLEKYVKENNFPPTISELYQPYKVLEKESMAEKVKNEEEEELVGDDW